MRSRDIQAAQFNSAEYPVAGRLLLGLAQTITLIALAVWPWLLGGVLPNSLFHLAAVATCILVVVALSLLVCERFSSRIPATVWILFGAMTLAVFQLVPLPLGVLKTVAPKSATIWQEFVPAPTATLMDSAEAYPISVSPEATKGDLAKLWIAAVFVLAGSTFSRSRIATAAFFSILALNGMLITLFGIVQRATWNGKIYWQIESPTASAFGPYINHNNGGGYLLMCLAAAAGVLAWRLIGRVAPSSVTSLTRRQTSNFLSSLGDRLAWLRLSAITVLNDARFLMASAFIVLIAGAVLLTLSRGAFLGMLVGGCCAALVFSRRGYRGTLPLALILVCCVLGLITWIQDLEVVRERLATLLDTKELQSARILHLRDAVSMIPDFWQTGSGIGSYRFANGMYRGADYEGQFLYVENQFVETMVVGGIVACLLMIAAILFAVRDTWRISQHQSDHSWATAVFAACLCGSQLVAAAFDFGWYIPANMITLAASVGLIHGMANQGLKSGLLRRLAMLFALLFFAVIGYFAVGETQRIATVGSACEQLKNFSKLERVEPVIDTETIREEIKSLEAALEHRPNDTVALELLGERWVRLARGQVYENLRLDAPGQANTKTIWALSSLSYLNMSAHMMQRSDEVNRLDTLRKRPELAQPLQKADACFWKASRHSPLSMRSHYNLSQLGLLVHGRPEIWRDELSNALKLAPQDEDIRWRAGIMEASAGDIEYGTQLVRESIELSPNVSPPLVMYCCLVLAPADFATQALPQEPRTMLRLADEHLNAVSRRPFREAVGARVIELIEGQDGDKIDELERSLLRGRAKRLQGLPDEAETIFVNVLNRFPDYLEMQFAYGFLLERLGRIEEAIERYDLCVTADPSSSQYAEALIRTRNRAAK